MKTCPDCMYGVLDSSPACGFCGYRFPPELVGELDSMECVLVEQAAIECLRCVRCSDPKGRGEAKVIFVSGDDEIIVTISIRKKTK
jgi:hypothetical protein